MWIDPTWWTHSAISLYQLVLHNWCETIRGMCSPVLWNGTYKYPLAADRKEYLVQWLQKIPFLVIWVVHCHITVNETVSRTPFVKTLTSYLRSSHDIEKQP